MYHFNEVVLIFTFFRHYKGIKIFITCAYLCNENVQVVFRDITVTQLHQTIDSYTKYKSETMMPIKAGHG